MRALSSSSEHCAGCPLPTATTAYLSRQPCRRLLVVSIAEAAARGWAFNIQDNEPDGDFCAGYSNLFFVSAGLTLLVLMLPLVLFFSKFLCYGI